MQRSSVKKSVLCPSGHTQLAQWWNNSSNVGPTLNQLPLGNIGYSGTDKTLLLACWDLTDVVLAARILRLPSRRQLTWKKALEDRGRLYCILHVYQNMNLITSWSEDCLAHLIYKFYWVQYYNKTLPCSWFTLTITVVYSAFGGTMKLELI